MTNAYNKWLLSMWLLLAAPGACPAERYLSVAEAEKLFFPQADRFERKICRLTADQAKAIAKRAVVKVLNVGNRLSLAYEGTNLTGVLVIDHVLGKHEIIDYAIALSPEGKVLQVEILEFRESHGNEIRSAKWRSQFTGKTSDATLKLNDDIYNISGATISCRHVTEGVKRVLATYDVVVRPMLAIPHGVSDLTKAPKP